MLPHPTHDRLVSLTFEERLGLLVDREAVERESKRLVTRLKFANLRQNATIEDLNTRAVRGLDKALFDKLTTGDWITFRSISSRNDCAFRNAADAKLRYGSRYPMIR